MTLSRGQRLALGHMEAIEAASDGAVDVEANPPTIEGGTLTLTVGMRTDGCAWKEGGVRLRQRESVEFLIPASFPLSPPTVRTPHKRFAKLHHVQWSRQICLYLSPEAEFNPSDGMFGVFQRWRDWLKAAAAGELDPADLPLHPPAVYETADERFVFYADAPGAPSSAVWLGTAFAERPYDKLGRYSVRRWGDIADDAAENEIALPAILMPTVFTFEYPTTARELVLALVGGGLRLGALIAMIQVYGRSHAEGAPMYLVVGAPMRRKAEGAPLRFHLTVWKLDGAFMDDLVARLGAETDEKTADDTFIEWVASAPAVWCRVFDVRPEVTEPRDKRAPSAWLRGKSVLLLGCGALGGPVAEAVVRAGAAKLDLLDKGIVKPGLLVRQMYDDRWVGYGKALATQRKLERIGLGTEVRSFSDAIIGGPPAGLKWYDYDLIIDATASTRVRFTLEAGLSAGGPPLISMVVGASATRGLVTVRGAEFPGGPLTLDRSAYGALTRSPGGLVFRDEFFPKQAAGELFFPEPGCSDPTFTGGYVDVAGLSMTLFQHALAFLSKDPHRQGFSAAVPFASSSRSILAFLPPPSVQTDGRSGFRICVSRTAQALIDAILKRDARRLGAGVETGGLLFGAIDEVANTVWIDQAFGPPPDSDQSPSGFVCGTEGVHELAAKVVDDSGGRTSFVGMWHSHPVSAGSPSETDMAAMIKTLALADAAPRFSVMGIVGHAASQPDLRCFVFSRAEMRKLAVTL
ncbi:ThiF family adenylyltransferase [Parvularcula oceani]|uniref:ThiF family adenylyltransferase n=1 Tax=Parvularcula oceani TaxID=1247963 RepID=UPI0004E19CB3|nr:ThiF family adenylyltransferase [Parvularcula oceani]